MKQPHRAPSAARRSAFRSARPWAQLSAALSKAPSIASTAAGLCARRLVQPLALAGALAAGAAWAAEPPDREGLTCTVAAQALAEGLRLEITFANQTAAPIALPAGPHLVLYRDAAATEAMEVTARIDRVQRTPLPVPPQGRVTGLFGMTREQTEALLCNAGQPAAAGLYFYEFSRRPTFRCLLREVALAALPMRSGCAPGPAPGR